MKGIRKEDWAEGEVTMPAPQRSGTNTICQSCAMLDQNDQAFISRLGSITSAGCLGKSVSSLCPSHMRITYVSFSANTLMWAIA